MVLRAVGLHNGRREWLFFVVYIVGVWVGRLRGRRLPGKFVSVFTYGLEGSCSCSYSLLIPILRLIVVLFSLRHRMYAIYFLGLFLVPSVFLLVLLLFRLGY
jgi:hypothetical protein